MHAKSQFLGVSGVATNSLIGCWLAYWRPRGASLAVKRPANFKGDFSLNQRGPQNWRRRTRFHANIHATDQLCCSQMERTHARLGVKRPANFEGDRPPWRGVRLVRCRRATHYGLRGTLWLVLTEKIFE